MSELKVIGKSMYGTKYSLDGAIPFSSVNLSALKYGDVIKDNRGNGMTLYVNECYSCKEKYLAGTLIFAPENCNDCYKSRFLKYDV